MENREEKIPIWNKFALTVEEAAQYTGIGMNKLRVMSDGEDCKYILWVGTRRMFKRRLFEEYLENQYSICYLRSRGLATEGIIRILLLKKQSLYVTIQTIDCCFKNRQKRYATKTKSYANTL